jgi:hypothetical protein
MKAYRPILILSVLFLVFISGACLAGNISREAANEETPIEVIESPTPPVIPAEDEGPPATQEEVSPEPASKRYTFDQLGISLEVPAELYVYKDPSVSYDDPSKLEGYLFYIQNYGYRGGPSSGDFQMYGHLQYNLQPIRWEEFAENTINSTMNAYANEIEINGLRGFDTQLSGVRNRYVYQFLINGQVLSIAVADPTEENKKISDQIISTIEFNPDKFTSASHLQKVVEPNGYYQMFLPEDWDTSFNAAAGIRLSDLEASSPDAEVVVEEVEGPHDNVLYKNGILMNFVILDDDSALTEPVMAAGIKNSYRVMYNGIEMTDYLFVEPSTVEGEIRELRFYHNGNSYSLRFSYAPGTDQGQIEWIIINLQISE